MHYWLLQRYAGRIATDRRIIDARRALASLSRIVISAFHFNYSHGHISCENGHYSLALYLLTQFRFPRRS
jgi:hypothetical protein